jgi:RNA polymerase sigma factor (sigma-70 family)
MFRESDLYCRPYCLLNRAYCMNYQEELIKIYPRLLGWAKNLMRDTENAKDLTQTTIEKCLKYESYYKDNISIKSWAFKIMKNEFINIYRYKSRRTEAMELKNELSIYTDAPTGEDLLFTNEIETGIECMPDWKKSTLRLLMQGFQYDEIAIIQDIPIGTVKSRIFLARKELKDTALINEQRILLKLVRSKIT